MFQTVFRKIESQGFERLGRWGVSKLAQNHHEKQGRRLHPARAPRKGKSNVIAAQRALLLLMPAQAATNNPTRISSGPC